MKIIDDTTPVKRLGRDEPMRFNDGRSPPTPGEPAELKDMMPSDFLSSFLFKLTPEKGGALENLDDMRRGGHIFDAIEASRKMDEKKRRMELDDDDHRWLLKKVEEYARPLFAIEGIRLIEMVESATPETKAARTEEPSA